MKKRYKQQKQQYEVEEQQNRQTATEEDKRRMKFYEEVFKKQEPQAEVQTEWKESRKQRKIREANELAQRKRIERQQQEAQRIAEREYSRKLIKKMHTQKTKKGQPLMRNFIQYALHKIEKQNKLKKQPQQ